MAVCSVNRQSLEEKSKEWEERYAREKEMYENDIRQLRIAIETRRKELDEAKEEVTRLLFRPIEFYFSSVHRRLYYLIRNITLIKLFERSYRFFPIRSVQLYVQTFVPLLFYDMFNERNMESSS